MLLISANFSIGDPYRILAGWRGIKTKLLLNEKHGLLKL